MQNKDTFLLISNITKNYLVSFQKSFTEGCTQDGQIGTAPASSSQREQHRRQVISALSTEVPGSSHWGVSDSWRWSAGVAQPVRAEAGQGIASPGKHKGEGNSFS